MSETNNLNTLKNSFRATQHGKKGIMAQRYAMPDKAGHTTKRAKFFKTLTRGFICACAFSACFKFSLFFKLCSVARVD